MVLVAGDALSGTMFKQALVGGVRWLLRGGGEEMVLGLAVLAILVAVAVYIIAKIRPHSAQHEPDTHELLSKFR